MAEMTLETCIDTVAQQLEAGGLFYGHGTDNSEDEAFALICHVLQLSFDVSLDRIVTEDERLAINQLVDLRIQTRKPLAYLTHEAYFCGLPFYVDERVIVPRSPISELIENGFEPWIDPLAVHRVLDLCTGSGCIAIACANFLPDAEIDAVELDADAFAVAQLNVKQYAIEDHVHLIQSDLFKQVPEGQRYEIIVSNPPYVNSIEMNELPEEFKQEPSVALHAEDEGLAIVVRILKEAKKHLTEDGILIVEVGNSRAALEKRFPEIPFTWLEFEFGGEGVFLLTADQVSKI